MTFVTVITPTLTLRNVSIHQQQQLQSKQSNSSAFNTFIKGKYQFLSSFKMIDGLILNNKNLKIR